MRTGRVPGTALRGIHASGTMATRIIKAAPVAQPCGGTVLYPVMP